MAAATQVQSKSAGKSVLGDQTQTLSFDSPPTEGNLLVCLANIDGSFTASMSSAGWTEIYNNLAAFGGHGNQAAWVKTAGAGESSDVIVDYGEVNRRGGMFLYEYSHAEVLSLDQFVVADTGGSANSLSTGTTAALSGTAVLAIALVALNDDNANLAGTSWTNGFTGDLAAEAAFVDAFSALKDLDGTDPNLETTATWNGSPELGTHGVLVFKTAAANGGLASFREATTTDVASRDVATTDVAGRDVGA